MTTTEVARRDESRLSEHQSASHLVQSFPPTKVAVSIHSLSPLVELLFVLSSDRTALLHRKLS